MRTLKRRISELIKQRKIFSLPRMDYRAISGGVPAELIVVPDRAYQRSAVDGKILELLGDWVFYTGLWVEFQVYVLIVPRVAALTDLTDRVGRIEGVRMVRGEIVYEYIDQLQFLSEYLDHKPVVSRSVNNLIART